MVLRGSALVLLLVCGGIGSRFRASVKPEAPIGVDLIMMIVTITAISLLRMAIDGAVAFG